MGAGGGNLQPAPGQVIVIEFITLYAGINDGTLAFRMRSGDGGVPTVFYYAPGDPDGFYAAFTGKWVATYGVNIGWVFDVEWQVFGANIDVSIDGYILQLP